MKAKFGLSIEQQDCYAIMLRRAASNISEYYDKVLKPVGLTVNQFSLLSSILKLGVCSVVQLSGRVGLEKSTLVRTVKPLIVSGHVEDVSLKGSRNRMLQLTKRGFVSLYKANILWQDAQSRIKREIGEESIDTLTQMLEVLLNLK